MLTLPATIMVFVAATSAATYHAEKRVAGATLKISVMQPVEKDKAEEIVEWLASTAEIIGGVYGRFPSPAPNIIVIPAKERSWGGDDAVTFGQVMRSNGGTVELYVNTDRPISEFYADWTATHELSHLMLPRLQRRHSWISEGFATYYQNVLMSRAGRYTPEMAWTKLLQGFDRGRKSSPQLSPNDATGERRRETTMKIYWSGAAIALLADIEIRQRSGGKQSLDTVLDRLQRCCLPTTREWTGPELFRRLDSTLDKPVFMPLYRRYADRQGFPDVDSVLKKLGVAFERGTLRLTDDAKLAELRRTLTARY